MIENLKSQYEANSSYLVLEPGIVKDKFNISEPELVAMSNLGQALQNDIHIL